MPAVLGMRSFGARNSDRDRLVVVSGSASYSTSILPPESSSATSFNPTGNTTIRAPWHNDTVPNGRYTSPTDEIWCHFRYRTGLNTAGNANLILGIAENGDEMIAVSAENSTNKLTIRVDGVVRATAASGAFSVNTWARVHLHVGGIEEGDVIRVYLEGNLAAPVVEYTLTNTDAAALLGMEANEFLCTSKAANTEYFDDFVAFDPTDAGFPGISFFISCDISEQVATADGADTDWTGSYADIDEIPADDADKIVAATVGARSTFQHAAVTVPNVFAVQVSARVTRTGTIAGENLGVLLVQDEAGTPSEASVSVAAPGDGDVSALFQVAPDGGAWSPTKYNDTRFGFETET